MPGVGALPGKDGSEGLADMPLADMALSDWRTCL